jgi:threonine/homoserine/homoserine lactone efflux protein
VIINFLQGFTLAIAAAVTPGPFQAFLLSQAVKNGWKRTLPAALSPLLSDGPIITLVLFILTQTPQWFLDGLRIVGGLFILYLGGKAFLSMKEGDTTIKPSPEAGRQSLFRAAVLNILNPNPYIFWSLVAGPILLSSWRKAAGLGISFIAGFYLTFICCLAVFILVFASAGRLDPRVNKLLNIIASLALLAFGLYQIIFGLLVLIR